MVDLARPAVGAYEMTECVECLCSLGHSIRRRGLSSASGHSRSAAGEHIPCGVRRAAVLEIFGVSFLEVSFVCELCCLTIDTWMGRVLWFEVVELRFRCGLVVSSSGRRWICRASILVVVGWVCVLLWRRWRALEMAVG